MRNSPLWFSCCIVLLWLSGCTHMNRPIDAWLLEGASPTHRAPTTAESELLSQAFAQAIGGRSSPAWRALGYESATWGQSTGWREAEPRTRGWGSYLLRQDASRALLLQAPHGDSDRHTAAIALALHRATGARMLAINSTHRGQPGADQANTPGAPFALMGGAAGRAGGGMRLVQLHGYGAETAARHSLPADGLVLSNGTRSPDRGLLAVSMCLKRAGFDARVFPSEAPYPGGTRNAVRAAMAASGDAGFVHLELGDALRASLVRDASRLEALATCL